ncbi:MAG: DUF1302 domain-containing protein [Micropepsaceae bacterium]
MQKSKLTRWSLKGSAAVLAMLGAVTSALAVETKFGDVSIVFDTTVSMGASMLTQGRNSQFLPEANGGPVDPRADVSLGAVIVAPIPTASGFGSKSGLNIYTNNGFNNDGSINADDGRLNFDRGDLIGATVKATHELQATWENYKFFARAVGFYDAIMDDKNAGDHSQLTDQALGDVGRNYELLDAFVSADYTVAELPVNLRVGKQVINWGESTFIQNGLNVFNPIDVASFRRPGSEIKEALVPVNALFGSVSFPFQVSLSGWYALDWEPLELDPSGTPFSTADAIASGSGVGGNNSFNFVTASPFGGNRRNCVASAGSGTQYVQTVGLLNDPTVGALGNDLLECGDSAYVDSTVRLPNGQHELIRLGQIDGSGGQVDLSGDGVTPGTTGVLYRGEDYQARDSGQFGIRATYFAEELNGTEFGFYYQNYHSRLPFVNFEAKPGDTAADLSFFLNSGNTEVPSGITARALPYIGCGLANSNATVKAVAAGDFTAAVVPTMFGTLNGGLSTAAKAQLKATPVSDPGDVLGTADAALNTLTSGGYNLYDAGGAIGVHNQYALTQLNCVLGYFQGGGVPGLALVPLAQSFDNAEFLLASMDGQVSVSYPEDIEEFGFSFNTTVGSWGVQGEATYRPSAPFQVDTDSLTIASLVNGCTFEMVYGAAGSAVDALATPDGSGVQPTCGSGTTSTNGIIHNEMFTAQVGTTAQFTGSEWFIDALGADIGTFVTEVGMVYTPNVEDTWVDKLSSAQAVLTTQYQNTGCQGTDLPGGGILGLDHKGSAACRPTDLSAGLVMLFTWQYNNFMDTGFAVSPRVVYSYDFEGTTASPYGNYMEDRQALNLGVDGVINNNLKVGVSYSNFFAGHVSNKSSDRDFASITASYSF